MNLLKVLSIENGTDSSDQNVPFQTVAFTKSVSDANGEIFSAEKPRVENLFAERDLGNGNTIAQHPLYGKLSIGARVLGTIETFETTPYQPEGFTKPQTRITLVVFDGENGLGKAALRLREYNAGPIDPTTKQPIILAPRVKVTA